MRLILCISVLFLFSCNTKNRNKETFVDGLEEIVPDALYVMHSMIYAKGEPWTTSNIFILRGTGDTVWIFGSGYGDFNAPCEEACNDNNFYLGEEFSGTGPVSEDVKPVDSVITHLFNLNRDSVILQFIVPHYHNDHINEEFIDAFYSTFNYPLKSDEKIWIHINDSIGALCDEPCCGTQPCPDKKNKYYGVPYMPHWKPEYKAMFTTMGSAQDVCNTNIKTLSSPLGTWHVAKAVSVADQGHTDGTINLQNAQLKLEISGTKSKTQCGLPAGWTRISVHGNVTEAIGIKAEEKK